MADDSSVDEYMAGLSPPVRSALDDVRRTVRSIVPEAEEVLRYGIPTYRVGDRSVVHIAGWSKHVSVYPVPSGDADFERDVAPYVSGKGTVRFPLSEPMPLDLVARLVSLLARR